MDTKNKAFSFPPSNGNMQPFIGKESLSSGLVLGTHNNYLSGWAHVLACQQQDADGLAPVSVVCLPRRLQWDAVGPAPFARTGCRGKRDSPETKEIAELKEKSRVLQAQINSAFQHINVVRAPVVVSNQANLHIRLERNLLKREVRYLKFERRSHLLYNNLQPDGILLKAVEEFTFFSNFGCNDAFLDLINYADRCKTGNGLCENLFRYSKVSIPHRREYQ